MPPTKNLKFSIKKKQLEDSTHLLRVWTAF